MLVTEKKKNSSLAYPQGIEFDCSTNNIFSLDLKKKKNMAGDQVTEKAL